METQELDKLESKILQSYNKDGMLETLLGVGLVFGGLNMLEHGSGFAGLIPILMILMARAWRRRITFPRLGYNELLVVQRRRKKRAMLVVLFTTLAVLGLGMLGWWFSHSYESGNEIFSGPHMRIVFGIPVALMVAGVAFVRKNSVLYFAAGLLLVLFIAADVMRFSAGYAFAVTGTLLLILGIVRLVQFLRANPKLEGDASYVHGQ